MTLQPVDASGSQRFTSDGGIRTGDINALRSPPLQTLEGPLGSPDFIRPVPIKGMPGLYYGKVTLREGRGPWLQEGSFPMAHASRREGVAVGDAPDVLRIPHLLVNQESPDPTSAPYRMMYASYLGSDVVGMHSYLDDELLFRATSSTDPTMVAVAGFPPALSPTRLMCLRPVEWAGVLYLMAGYVGNGTAASSLQAITNLTTNPPTFAYVPTAAAIINDMIQLPDGTLMIYNNGRITMVDTSVAPAAATFTDHRATLPAGGYFVGLLSLGGGPPMVYAVVPQNSNLMTFEPGAIGTSQGKLVAISLDGWVVQDVTTGLPWVTFATKVRDGIMCDDGTTSHVFLNGRRITPMTWFKHRYTNPGVTFVCRGHHTDGQRFWWKVNEVKSGVATQAWWDEVHFDLLDEEGAPTSLPISNSATLGVDVQTVGGWNLPYFPTTRVLVEYSGTTWWRQKQPPLGQLAYDQRKMTGGAVGSGDQFETGAYQTWPVMQYPGMEGCPMITVKLTAPPNRHIRTGQDAAGGYTTGASVKLEELLSGVKATFTARGPDERRPVREFPTNRSWGYGFQPKITLAHQTGGTDESRYTPNGFPATYEFLMYKDGIGNIVPAQYRNLDASAVLRRFA